MNTSELLVMQSIRHHDRKYAESLERLLKTTEGFRGKKQGGVHVKNIIEKRLSFIYNLTK